MKLSTTLFLILVIVMVGHARHIHSRHFSKNIEHHPNREMILAEEIPVSCFLLLFRFVSVYHLKIGTKRFGFSTEITAMPRRNCVKDDKTWWVYCPVKQYYGSGQFKNYVYEFFLCIYYMILVSVSKIFLTR